METNEDDDDWEERSFGLNRTMQYGNTYCPDLFPTSYIRLNRTMQYGNSYIVAAVPAIWKV